jgi:hypothetical protein
LFVPPQYQGQLSEQYSIFKSPTYGNLLMWRGLAVDGDRAATADALRQAIRIYPFDVPILEDLGFDDETNAEAAPPEREEPPQEEETRFVSVSGRPMSAIAAGGFGFYRDIDTLVQEEPAEALGPEILGLLASVGIERGKPLAPDPRMKAILVEAAAAANATARALAFRPRDAAAYLYEGSAWYTALLGQSREFARAGARLLDARTMFFTLSTMADAVTLEAPIGTGSQHAIAATDANGNYLDGERSYRLALPKDIAAKHWSVAVYDPQTRSMLQTPRGPTPGLSSRRSEVVGNEDGSTSVYFGPEAPAGRERNWIQTVPGKGWFTILRLYEPLEAWFDKTWRPGEIEPVDSATRRSDS